MFLPIETLIPHRAPMRFIDALVECTDTAAVATACFHSGHFAVADDRVLETALIECVAQTVAAAQGQRSANRAAPGGPVEGMLVAVTDFHFQSHVPAERPFCIQVRELRRLGPLLQISGILSCDGQTVASGELTLYA